MLARRLITIPSILVVWLIWLGTLPIWFVLAILVDVYRRNGAIAIRCATLVTFYLSLELFGIAVCGAAWLWGAVCRVDDDRWARLHFWLEARWGALIFWAIVRVFEVKLDVVDRAELARGPYLLFPRHTSIGESLIAVALVSHAEGLQLRYVFKKVLVWAPCLDIVGHRVPNVFIDRSSIEPAQEIERIQGLALNLGPRDGVLIYPEGTRFSEAKRARMLKRLRSEGIEDQLAYANSLRFVLPPRTGGPIGLLEASEGADVVFCAHVGFEATGTLARMWAGELLRQTVHVEFRRVSRDEIPTGRDARATWLRREWQRMDEWVAEHQ
jgi:1-acyl-sn-glycerol-3-phosphate acyltransferase